MTKLPVVYGKQVVKAFQKTGWTIKSQKGSHVKMCKDGISNVVIIPVNNKTIPKDTLSNIIKDSDVDFDEFIELL